MRFEAIRAGHHPPEDINVILEAIRRA